MALTRKQKQGGYMVIRNHNDSGKDVEYDTFTCRHCQKVVRIRPMCDPVELGGRCSCCDGLLCPSCASVPKCTHIEKRLQDTERRDALYQAMK